MTSGACNGTPFTFMLEALRSVSNELRSKRNIPLVVCACAKQDVQAMAFNTGLRNAAAIVIDEPYGTLCYNFKQIKTCVGPVDRCRYSCILTPQAVRPGQTVYKFLNATKSKTTFIVDCAREQIRRTPANQK